MDVLELSRITETDLNANLEASSDALANWGLGLEDGGEALDQIFRATQKSGVSFADLSSQLADSGIVLRELGFSFEESTALLASLGKAGVDTADVMPALQKTLATAAAAGKDASEVFASTVDAIKSAPSDTEAAAKAMEVFGTRSGPRLAALIREGKLGYDDLLGTIVNGTDSIQAAGKDTQDFGEKWQLIKNRVLVALEPVAMRVFDAVGKGMDFLSEEVIPRAEKAWNRWGPGVIATVKRAGEVIKTTFTTIRTVVGTVIDFFSKKGGDAEGTASKLGETVSRLKEMFVSAFNAVKVVVETAVTIITELWDRFGEGLVEHTAAALQAVWAVFDGAITILTGIFDLIKAILTGKWGEAWDAIKQIVSGAWQVILGIVETAWQVIQGVIDAGLGTLRAVWDTAWNAIATLASDVWEGIKSTASNAVDGIVGFFRSLPERLGALAGDLASAGANLGSSLIGGMIDAVAGAAGAAGDFARGFGNALISWVNRNIIDKINDLLEFSIDPPGPGPKLTINPPDLPHLPHFAMGTSFAPGGPAVVGEFGREIVNLPRGSEVVPNHRVRGQVVEEHIHVIIDGREVAEAVRRHDRSLK